jgi:uncharacterized membrane protein
MMANEEVIASADVASPQPKINTINVADLKEVWDKGLDDFKEMPTYLVFLCLIYPLVTFVFARAYAGFDMVPLVFPLLAGYTLIGPLVATSMYELSRRREYGLDHSRMHVFDILKFSTIRPIATLGLLLMVIYILWLAGAQIIYDANFGGSSGLVPIRVVDASSAGAAVVPPTTAAEFVSQLFGTAAGWTIIIVGCAVGFVFAVVVLALSVVSFPMILDRHVSAMVAARTSIRAVIANPVTMAVWGLVVAVALLIGSLPFFIGLAIVMPILGHATWHLYRKVVGD